MMHNASTDSEQCPRSSTGAKRIDPNSEAQKMKGLRSLDVSVADVVPSFVPGTSVNASSRPVEAYKPSKLPPKGKTEMNQDERHSAHLRKRRQAKLAKRTDENKMRVMAKFDPKIREKLEKGKVVESLAANRNVTIVGHTGGKAGKNAGGKDRAKAIRDGAAEKKGRRWKHDLTNTLTKDHQPKKR